MATPINWIHSRAKKINDFSYGEIDYKIVHSGVIINDLIIIAKKKSLFRLLGHLDWAKYTPKTLAEAMDAGNIELYYQKMRLNKKSPSSEWKDKAKENKLKKIYKERQIK